MWLPGCTLSRGLWGCLCSNACSQTNRGREWQLGLLPARPKTGFNVSRLVKSWGSKQTVSQQTLPVHEWEQ
jgi:hypothetical protein